MTRGVWQRQTQEPLAIGGLNPPATEVNSTLLAEFAAARPTVTPIGERASVRLRPAACHSLLDSAFQKPAGSGCR